MKTVALVTYKYDEDYLDDLRKNIEDLADEIIIKFDQDGDFWKDEGRYRINMIRQAERLGADYVIVIDPDERFEKGAAKKIKRLLAKYKGQRVVFEFNFRELYAPNKYRHDGVWGAKTRNMVFPLFKDNEYSKAKLHTPRHPINDDYKIVKTGLNVYHLKHIRPELRKARKDIYNALDPKQQYNEPGYDYLDDETGIALRTVPFWRMYRPAYREYKIDRAMFDVAKRKIGNDKK